MKRVYALLIVLACFVWNHAGANSLKGSEANRLIRGSEEVLPGKYSSVPEFIKFRTGSEVPFQQFEKWARYNLNLPFQAGFKLISADNDRLGYTHYRYVQTWGGHSVEGSMYILHVMNGKIRSMNGLIYNNINAATAQQPKSACLTAALNHIGASKYKWQDAASEKEIKYIQKNQNATYFPQGELVYVSERNNLKGENLRLAYKFDVYAYEPMSRQYVFVDAQSGKVINQAQRIHDTDVQGTAVTAYSGTQTITTDSVDPTTYRLRETSRGNGLETYDLQGATSGTGVDFLDTDNYWNNVNGQLDEYAGDAHFAAEKTYDYYWLEHGRNSIDNNGFALFSRVHYGNNYVNAFWDGTQMTYGDGNGTYTPLTSLDIGGHEITHGLTEFSANLVYSYESGALNESFSDIFGNTIRQYAKQSPVIDWLIGNEIGGTPFRSMSQPGAYGDPDTYNGINWATGPGDNGGVHTNSGVQNYWYYLMVEGGVGSNDFGNAFNITGLGLDTAADIAFRNLTVYLTPNSQYADARFYAIQSAIDLYGPCTSPVITTTNAWYAVGVGSQFVNAVVSDFTSPVVEFCAAPATVQFTNQSTNGGYYTWSFGDGNSSTDVNPVHVYQNLGSYDVQLIADGGACGIDSIIKSAFILIDTNLPCNFNMDPGLNLTLSECDGNLFDTGGPTGDYGDNEDTYITIAPGNASQITLTFTEFAYENNFDYLYIYDGPSTASPLIGQYTGNNLPNGGVIVSTTGSITLRHFTDMGVAGAGFALSWQCTYPTQAPIVDFIVDDSATCTGQVNFTDKSTGGPYSWLWDFGDGNTSNLQNPTHTYTANGVYNVQLSATNVIGIDSLLKSAFVTVNMPVAPTAVDDTTCFGFSTMLAANGSGVLQWYDQPVGGPLLDTGAFFITPPLGATTTFYVADGLFTPSVYEGPVDNTIGAGNNYGNQTDRYLIFDCYTPCILKSVWVMAQGGGNRTIELRDNNNTVLQSATVNIPDGPSRVELNFNLPVGTDLRLGKVGSANLYRNSTGAAYPYNVSGLVSITGANSGAPGNTYYYFYYDWELQEPPCLSSRTPVTVSVVPAPVSLFSFTQNLNIFDFADLSTGGTSINWDFGDGNTSQLQNPQHVYTTPGTYQVILSVSNGYCTVNSIQTVVVTGGVGIEEPGFDQAISVLPNPATDVVNVYFLTANTKTKLECYNQTGQLMLAKELENVSKGKVFDIDVSKWPAGVYNLRISNSDNRIIRKFIKR